MKILGLLSWFDERPRDLTNMVASLPAAGINELVALDGAYALWENAKPRSPENNYDALTFACHSHGIRLHLHTPSEPWASNEIEKRTHLFHLGEQHTAETDWFMVVDADETIAQAPADLHQRLERTDRDVGEVLFRERKKSGALGLYPIPILFRAQRGIRVVGNHYTYKAVNGTPLWGNAAHKNLAPRIELHDVIVDHHTRNRERARRGQARAYYKTRDRQRAEPGACDTCDKPAAKALHTNWRPAPNGGFVADWTEACVEHVAAIEAENRRRLLELGHPDPDNLRVEYRLGPAP